MWQILPILAHFLSPDEKSYNKPEKYTKYYE